MKKRLSYKDGFKNGQAKLNGPLKTLRKPNTGPARCTDRLTLVLLIITLYMKINRLFFTMTLSGLTLLSGVVLGQERYELRTAEDQIADSVQTARHEQEVKQERTEQDATRLSDAKEAHNETKARAKETRRIDREASSAAREAKMALRGEKKAQKARKDADKQSRKAVKAKDISDRN